MVNYYLNLNAQSNGDHEIHKETCYYYYRYKSGTTKVEVYNAGSYESSSNVGPNIRLKVPENPSAIHAAFTPSYFTPIASGRTIYPMSLS